MSYRTNVGRWRVIQTWANAASCIGFYVESHRGWSGGISAWWWDWALPLRIELGWSLRSGWTDEQGQLHKLVWKWNKLSLTVHLLCVRFSLTLWLDNREQ